MQGLMQDRPLLISSLIEHANAMHPRAAIASRTVEGPVHRCTYGDIHRRSKQVANALQRVVIGGSAAPRAMSEKFETRFGAFVVHAWGMAEMSPLGTVCNLLPKHWGFDLRQRLDVQAKQGRAMFGVEMRINDDAGRPLPHTATGKLPKTKLREMFKDCRLP